MSDTSSLPTVATGAEAGQATVWRHLAAKLGAAWKGVLRAESGETPLSLDGASIAEMRQMGLPPEVMADAEARQEYERIRAFDIYLFPNW
ncbi:hypothetical protein CAL14_06005 [Bordetella genomosp. 9]|uniref:hypothetical protein n=1 Tax=Bordetella genomosp. 9 TaxID=1416803 RepID=UPI000A292F8F|nr:hypothetical protein [Bordetella genomosp. 9]ARP89901.1 hypothetical protein CAL14_06005 [Bordetella genomosp. 9]